MSEEPDGPAPEPGSAEAPAPGRWSRWLPPWVLRRPAIAAASAGVLVAALIALVVFEATRPSAPSPEYASPPGQPCALVSSAELARYLPGATGTPANSDTTNVRDLKIGGCKWSSTSGGEDRTLGSYALVFGAPGAIADARQSYRATLTRLDCHCKGVTVSSRAVTGLGDQATEVFIAAAPDANPASAPNATNPGTTLLVQSSNALVIISLNTTGTASGAPLSPPPSAAQLAGMITMARGALAVLARPASVPAAAIGPVSPEPHYASRRDSCKLISAATLDRYAPGTVLIPTSTPGSSPSSCSWASGGTSRIMLNLTVFPRAQDAHQSFGTDASAFVHSVNDVTVTGVQELENLGENAEAIFQSRSGNHDVDLLVWSGNAELDLTYTDPGSAAGPDRATLLAGAIAMSRDGLAALARPAASAYQQGPVYASPGHPCQLIRASTLDRYAPGAVVGQLPPGGPPDLSDCAWNASNGDLFLTVTTYSDPDSAEGGFESGVQFARTSTDAPFHGEQQVKGLGQQATAVFVTGIDNSPEVDVYAWSGNVSVEMSYSDDPLAGPPLSRAAKLAADIAMLRDVLAGLHRT